MDIRFEKFIQNSLKDYMPLKGLSFENIFSSSNIFIDNDILNDKRYLNKHLIKINNGLPKNGIYAAKFISNSTRKKELYYKYPKFLNNIIIIMDVMFHRIFSKFRYFEKLYFFITKGKNRSFSKSEIFGRLYFCGFEIINAKKIENYDCIIAIKKGVALTHKNPSYRFIIKLPRLGKNNKIINVYKIRTMHPYSEYLQNYFLQNHKLDVSGKIKNDFRISSFAKYMRKYWIDEIPMIFNILKGDLKIFGVRPISEHYFNLYTDELKKIRHISKPGFIPPYYVDLPKSLDEIIISEINYLKSYRKKPIYTDLIYLFKALKNVIFSGVRSS